jgi:hypothetical protein
MDLTQPMPAAPAIEPAVERSNTRHLYMELAWMAFPFALEWYYLSIYAILLGATSAHLGVLGAGRALLQTVGSGLANRWQVRYPNRVRALAGPLLTARIFLYLMLAFVPFLPAYRVDALIAMVLLSAVPTGISQGVFLGILPTAVSKHNLAQVVARRSMLMSVTIMICILFVGQFLERVPEPQNYQVGFVISFIASALSWWHVQKLKTPDVVIVRNAPKRTVNVWKNPQFVRFALVIFAVNTSVFMAGPIVPLQLVKGLNASDTWLSIFGMAEMAAGAVFMIRLDSLIRRFGARRLMILCAFATASQVLLLGLAKTQAPYLIGELVFGAAWFVVNVLFYNLLVEFVPHQDLAEYAAIYQVLINVALFAGPLFGTFLVEHGLSYPAALLLIAGLRFISGILTATVRISGRTRSAAHA